MFFFFIFLFIFFFFFFFFFSSRRRHTRFVCDWSSDVCSSDLRALPAGTCPTVGIAGLALGGGLGVLGRRYGLTCDRMLSAQLVLADGSVVTCDEHHETDLFRSEERRVGKDCSNQQQGHRQIY